MATSFVPLLQQLVGEPAAFVPDEEPVVVEPEPEPEPIDVEAERQAAWEAGIAQGRAEREPEIELLKTQVQVVGAAVEACARARREALDRAAEDIASIVTEVARKVLGDAFALNPDALPLLVLRALDRLPEEDEVWIRVPPSAVDAVAAAVPERHRDRVRADPTLVTGCVVETRHVAIDATLDAAMESIGAAAQAWVAGRTPSPL